MEIMDIKNLNKSFGGIRAIVDLAFSIESGEVLGIIGPNGAGKTTLFNLLSGFLKPDSGSIKFKGMELTRKNAHQIVNLGIARTFQIPKPFFDMNVLETLLIPFFSPRGRRLGLDNERVETRALRILNKLGLESKLTQNVMTLSQGEHRLLDIGRALATEPEVILLDEPFSGLGQDNIDIVSKLLISMKMEGVSVIIIEHHLKELMRLVERVIVINFGNRIAAGTPAQIVQDRNVIEAYLGQKGKKLGFT